ncbi:hypothetical protein HanRHA438_Chr11g0497311 [Helianthus annuus]|uniref:Uncharacterized protein n=1 Tax=Helianthus annuus TaxID=4232 RepID=A0A9K3MZJ2_HELAN|nr:hypothetical protein HanXRQr2_Chr11g0484841 [Helianthus annuus]KAJ0870165.1 hypothetical protein HanRHA438_Chr11g0497311 [Helianthus annuus]KAJ0874642.1 hypothetical protein HanPSC8_Chr11g0466641 [Helianthus annuus]
MSCLASASISFEPHGAKAVLSSSYLIVPLLSVSMVVNNDLNPWISSADKFSAMTLRASFLSLFIAPNCFIRDQTALSIGLSDAPGCSVPI